MPAKRFILIIAMGLLQLYSQKDVQLRFIPVFGDQLISTGIYIKSGTSDSILFTTVKFYISGIRFFKKDKCTWKENESYHLMDLFDPKRSVIKVPDIDHDEIKFSLGLDSMVNTGGALGGDLDPTIGMYWAWQSGYINIKIEGKYKSCNNHEKDFSYHLGGYMSPFATIQNISLKWGTSAKYSILADMRYFISHINICDQKDIMSPGKSAVELSTIIAKSFKVN